VFTWRWKLGQRLGIAVLAILLLWPKGLLAQGIAEPPSFNVRLSFLLFPPTPLLTVEARTFGNLTVQLETNFVNTHGVNLKYFVRERMDGAFVFLGSAFVRSKWLRRDAAVAALPYAGVGYAFRFGANRAWDFDNRIGLGRTVDADTNRFYPVVKTGIGYVF
jgi:hypothetical protein